MKNKRMKILSCSVFGALYLLVSVISLICSTYFFQLAHTGIMSWALAIGFELGAMSCLLSTMVLPRNKQGLVWVMFVILTLFQCMGNMYAAYVSLDNYKDWIDMFGLNEMEEISQKRVLAGISGIILPLVALGFIRIMADMLQNKTDGTTEDTHTQEMMFGASAENGGEHIEKSEVETESGSEDVAENTAMEETNIRSEETDEKQEEMSVPEDDGLPKEETAAEIDDEGETAEEETEPKKA